VDSAFPVKKLFILIPQSLYTPTDLKELSTDSIHDSKYWMEAAVVSTDYVHHFSCFVAENFDPSS
jgi:hypothetical protein